MHPDGIIPSESYEFSAVPWQYNGPAGWVFVSLPRELSVKIRGQFKSEEEGWGRLKAEAQVGATRWKTAIWFDTKADTYILPLKAAVRKKENILPDESLSVTVWISGE